MDEETESDENANSSLTLWNHSIHTLFYINYRYKTPGEGSAQGNRYARSVHLSYSYNVMKGKGD